MKEVEESGCEGTTFSCGLTNDEGSRVCGVVCRGEAGWREECSSIHTLNVDILL